jgi:hypothetical protein
VLVASAQTANQPNITYSGGTGTWTTSLANTTWHGSGGKLIVITHVYQAGDTFPTLAAGGVPSTFSFIACAYYGAAGVDTIATTTTANSATINYPTVLPSQPSDEALFAGAIMSGATSFSNPSTLTTCSTTSDQTYARQAPSGSPAMALYQANLGPCSPTYSGQQTLVSAGSGDSIGATILLSPTIAHLRDAVGSSRFRNNTGAAYYLPGVPISFDLTTLSQGWTDILAIYSNWNMMEPNNCDEYSWDYLDNMILNASSLGLKVSLGITAGNSTPCGGANEAPCTGFKTTGLNVPSWAYTATACDNNHSMVAGTDYITSMWTKTGWGPPTGTVNLIFDPNNPYYQHEWDRAIAALGSRYSSTNNVVSVKVTGENKDTPEVILQNGANGSSIACNGTAAQCTAICGSSSCSRTLNDAAQWLGVGPGYTTSNFIPNDLEAAEQHFESSWSNAFPNAALMAIIGNTPSPPGTYVNKDTFTPDMIAYDLSNHPNVMEEMNASLGWQAPSIVVAKYMPYSSQPFLGIAYQTIGVENYVSGAQCASKGLYSTSNTQCVTPTVYAGLAHMMFPYIEFAIADWQAPQVQPWIKLVHDLAYKQ